MADSIQLLGGVARWLGLERTAATIGGSSDYQPPAALVLDPTDTSYASEALEGLCEVPHHPELFAQLYAHGFADACPATVAMAAKQTARASLWPPSYDRGLRADLLNHARYAESLLVTGDDDPGPAYLRNLLALNRRYYEEEERPEIADTPDIPDTAETAGPIVTAMTAKRRFIERELSGPGVQLDRLRLQMWDTTITDLPDWEANTYRWVDPDRPETPPTRDMFVATMDLAVKALLADQRPLGVAVLHNLWSIVHDSELQWLLVETCVEEGDAESAARVLREGGEPAKGDAEGWDRFRCASARIALAQGDFERMAAVLEEVERSVMADPVEATDRNPYSALMVVERKMRQAEPLTDDVMTIAMRALLANAAWPAANRMMTAMSLSLSRNLGRTEGIFDSLREVGQRMPGELSIWRVAARIVDGWPEGSVGLMAALQEQITRVPFVKAYWQLLAELCGDPDLAQAIRDDLVQRAGAAEPRRRTRA